MSWDDAVKYAKWLSEQTGKRYRLPTEAEWEYAARAGTETEYWWGNEIKVGVGKSNDNIGHFSPVGSFQPNPFGLYDTAGNVCEWVEDCGTQITRGTFRRKGLERGELMAEKNSDGQRVIRGGSWFNVPGTCVLGPGAGAVPTTAAATSAFDLPRTSP